MPPFLALLICTGFVLYLLRLDRQQAPRVSAVMWLPAIWMLSLGTKPLASWFDVYAETAEAGSPLDRAFQSALLCLGLLVLARRKLNWSIAIKQNAWLIALLSYMLVSILWSDIAYVSFKRWVRELGAVTMAFVVLTEKEPRQAVESLFRRTIYILIPFSLLLIKYYPEYGVVFSRWTGELMWVGMTLQKNGLGQLCFLAAFFLVWQIWKRKRQSTGDPANKNQTRVDLLLLIMTLFLLKGPSMYAASATAIAVLAAGLSLLAGLAWMQRHRIRLKANAWGAIIAAVIGLGIITPLVGGKTVGSFSSALGRNATLTGRTEIWAQLLPSVERQPVLGSGFGAFWTTSATVQHEVNEAHNGYLEVCLGLGIIGLLITVGFLLWFARKAARALADDYHWAAFCLGNLFMASLGNLSEATFESFTRHLTAVVLFLSISLPASRRARQGEPNSAFSQSTGIPEFAKT